MQCSRSHIQFTRCLSFRPPDHHRHRRSSSRLSISTACSWSPIYFHLPTLVEIKLAFLAQHFSFVPSSSDVDVFSDRNEASLFSKLLCLINLIAPSIYSFSVVPLRYHHVKTLIFFYFSQLRDDPQQCKLQRFGSSILHSDEVHPNQTRMSFQIFWL